MSKECEVCGKTIRGKGRKYCQEHRNTIANGIEPEYNPVTGEKIPRGYTRNILGVVVKK